MFWKLSYRSKRLVKIDLHVHTTASDGRFTPQEVVKLASAKGISYLAITDHDTIAGLEEASTACAKYKVHFFPGLEFSTSYEKQEIHLLGYNIDRTSPRLIAVLTQLQEARKNRITQMVIKLAEAGIDINIEDVQKKFTGKSLGRPHIALVLKERGIVRSIDEGIKNYLSPGCPAYIPRLRLSPFEAIDLIKKAHGFPVLAHPGLECPTELISALINHGLLGIEVFHPRHSTEQKAFYLKFAAPYHLLVTGGSDFHGHEAKDIANFGTMQVPLASVQKLKSFTPNND